MYLGHALTMPDIIPFYNSVFVTFFTLNAAKKNFGPKGRGRGVKVLVYSLDGSNIKERCGKKKSTKNETASCRLSKKSLDMMSFGSQLRNLNL